MHWLYIVLIVIGSYIVVSIISYLIQDLFFFHPEKLKRNFRFKFKMKFNEVQLKGADDCLIDGLYFPAENAEQVIFYFKGNTRSIKGWSKFAKDFTTKGVSFFLFDYPGFGKSTGECSEKNIHANSQIAYNWLKDRFGEENIIIYGRSLGAGFATYIAKENNPSLLILDSPFYSIRLLVRYYTRILPLRWLLKYKSPLNDYIKEVKCDVHIIHGDKDITIPYRFSLRLKEINPDKIELHTIHGARHNNLPKFESYHQVLDEVIHERR